LANIAQSAEVYSGYTEAIFLTKSRDMDEHEQNEIIIPELISRHRENTMLKELRNMRDELEIISLLQADQHRVTRDMGKIGGKWHQHFLHRFKHLQDELDDQVLDVANLIKLATRISTDVSPARSSRLPSHANDLRSIKSSSSSRTPLSQMKHSTLLLPVVNWPSRAQSKGKSSFSSRL
jgi:hypothetical protein